MWGFIGPLEGQTRAEWNRRQVLHTPGGACPVQLDEPCTRGRWFRCGCRHWRANPPIGDRYEGDEQLMSVQLTEGRHVDVNAASISFADELFGSKRVSLSKRPGHRCGDQWGTARLRLRFTCRCSR